MQVLAIHGASWQASAQDRSWEDARLWVLSSGTAAGATSSRPALLGLFLVEEGELLCMKRIDADVAAVLSPSQQQQV